MVELDPLDPATARQMYLDERRNDLADATIQSHGYRLTQFVDWCNRDGIDNLNDLSGRDIHRFRVERRSEDDLATATMKGQLATLRGSNSQRFVALSKCVCEILDDWLVVNHPSVVDDYGRSPLFATRRSRLSRNRGRTIAYQYTRPCVYANRCPHEREIETCQARPTERAHACPSALSPHPIRRGAITFHLQRDTPEKVVSDRMDVGLDVIDRHYDQRSAKEKVRRRRRYLPDE